MSQDKRLCRAKSRKNYPLQYNYHSHAAYLKARARLRLQKLGRCAARSK